MFWAPACQEQGLFIIFLFIEDSCNVKVCLVAKMHVVRTLRALQPLRKFLLRAFLTEIVKGKSLLFVMMFIFKDWGRPLASEAGPIPELFLAGIAFEAPYDDPGWYPSHKTPSLSPVELRQ